MAKTLVWVIVTILALVIVGGAVFMFYNPFQSSIASAYRTQLDRLTSTYLEDKNVACVEHTGTWKESSRAVGCFDIGEDWDSTWCESAEGSIVENICNGLEGTTWLCDQNNAGCKY